MAFHTPEECLGIMILVHGICRRSVIVTEGGVREGGMEGAIEGGSE